MFQVLESGLAFTHPNGLTINRPTGAPHYVFVHYLSPAVFYTPDGAVPCEGHCILLEPDVPHLYSSLCAPFVNDWVHFCVDEPQAEDYMRLLNIRYNVLLKPENPDIISSLVAALRQAEFWSEPWRKSAGSAHIMTLLQHISQIQEPLSKNSGTHKDFLLFSKIRESLYRMPQAGLHVIDLAQQANLSLSRFHHLYHEIFGCAVGDDIAKGRLQRAKYLLKNSSLSIALIAEESGYTNDTHMIRHFNSEVGMTPARYRKAQL